MKHYLKTSFLTTLIFIFLNIGCSKKKNAEPLNKEPVELSAKKTLKSFEFKVAKNEMLKQDLECEIVGDTVFAYTFSGVSLSSLIPVFSFEGSTITVNNKKQVSDSTANDYTKEVVYTITAQDNSKKNYIVKFRDTGLPSIYISTNNVAIESKEIYVDGNLKIAGDISGNILYEGKIEIKGRGNSTWGMPKKPYKIKLEKKSSLLNMPADKNWVLLASYADKTLIRNELAFELSRRTELAFTPRGRFAEVFLNGVYQGSYQLVEQIKEAKHKVNIEEQAENVTSLPDIAGGYLLEVDGFAFAEKSYFSTPKQVPVSIKYPDEDEITPQQKEYIANYFTTFENTLFAENFADPAEGFRKYLDVESYINYYLVNEIMGNSDMFWSTYMYKKRDDPKLYTGPVWDFDIAANNDRRLGDAAEKLMLTSGHDFKHWINRMMEDRAFRQKIRQRWNEIRDSHVKRMPSIVDELAGALHISQKKNFKKWPIIKAYVYLNFQVADSYEGEVEYLKNHLIKRIAWLDSKFNSAEYQ